MTTSNDWNPFLDPDHVIPDKPVKPSGPINVMNDGDYGVLQELVDSVYLGGKYKASRMDLICMAEVHDVSADLMEVVELMPSGTYTRAQMCDQMNSIITAHGWGLVYGTVE